MLTEREVISTLDMLRSEKKSILQKAKERP